MLRETKRRPDGSVEQTIRKLTRAIRAADGTFRTMLSLDGETWRLASQEPKEQRRLQSAQNLQGKRWTKQKIKAFDARINPGVERELPGLLPVPRYGAKHGKDKGKAQKYRRNLRRKPEKLVRIMKPVHAHVCPDDAHPYKTRRHLCSCEFSRKKFKLCGGIICLHATMQEVFNDKKTVSRHEQHQ